MKYKIIAAYLLVITSEIATAQNMPITTATIQSVGNFLPTTSQEIKAQNLLEQYNAKYRGTGLEGRKVLDSVHAHGLTKTAENVKTVRSLLSSTVTSEEKVALTRLLASLYTYDDKTGMNNAITQDLRGLKYSSQKDVARAAILAFSRLGYFQDSREALLYAKNNGVINIDEYYGELAHIAAFAPAIDQLGIVSEIKNSKNRYAMEILAFTAQNSDLMRKVYPETQKIIQSCLEENEPEFSQALGEFSLVDAVRYATWLQSIATLRSQIMNAKYGDVVLAKLNDDKTEPRKIMAFLSSSDGKKFIGDIGQRSTFETALQRISLYSKQLPQNTTMRDMVQEIADTINSVKG